MKKFLLMLAAVAVLASCHDRRNIPLVMKSVQETNPEKKAALVRYNCAGKMDEDANVELDIYLPARIGATLQKYKISGIYNVSDHTTNRVIVLIDDGSQNDLCQYEADTFTSKFTMDSKMILCKKAFQMNLQEDINVVIFHDKDVKESEIKENGIEMFARACETICVNPCPVEKSLKKGQGKEVLIPKRCGMGVIKA